MTATVSYTALEQQASVGRSKATTRKGNVIISWITSTDHKTIGYLYLITSFLYFCLGGVMALVIRAQLFEPGEALDVYSGPFTVRLPLEAVKGDHTLTGTLRYQACDNAACYPPKSLPVEVVFSAK